MISLTNKQSELLAAIIDFNEKGLSPTLRDLCAETGDRYSLVQRRVVALETKRYIRRAEGKARSITVLRKP